MYIIMVNFSFVILIASFNKTYFFYRNIISLSIYISEGNTKYFPNRNIFVFHKKKIKIKKQDFTRVRFGDFSVISSYISCSNSLFFFFLHS